MTHQPIGNRAELLMHQAHMTAQTYMLNAMTDIDELFGKGYAAKHPELVSGYMNAAALDFLAMSMQEKL
jgi:hypothetical protein